MMPAGALAANLFMRFPGNFYLGALWTHAPIQLPSPKSWSLLIM
jgi:hypothetical protein